MTHTPPTPTVQPGGLAPDERLRQQGAKLVMSIASTLRVGRAYASQNQVFRSQLAGLLEAIQPVLQHQGEAVLVAHESDLYMNGVRVPVNQASFKFQQTVLELFTRQCIAGLRFQSSVTGADLGRLFDLLLRLDGPTGVALIESATAQGLTAAAPVLNATVGGAPDAPSATTEEEEERIANQIFEPRIELPETSATRRHGQAVRGARTLLMPTSLQSTLEVRHAKRVVQPLVEGVSMSEPVVVGLSALNHHDEFTYAHAVNVCGLSVAIGHFLGLDRRALTDLGVAALLHDVGKSAVAAGISHDLEEFTASDREAAERHPLEGAKLLARSTRLNATTLRCIRVALEHHATGESGYPALPTGWKTSLLSRIVALADCYVSLQGRVGHNSSPASPSEALGMVMGPLSHRFDAATLWALVRSVGYYPAGQIVEMDDGGIAVVLAPNPDDLSRPNVRMILSWNGARLAPHLQEELRPIPADRFVARAFRLSDYPSGAIEAIEATRQAA